MENTKKYYAGVGPRVITESVFNMLVYCGEHLSSEYILRSGGAQGSDTAFEVGCVAGTGQREIFLPWNGFGLIPEEKLYIDNINYFGINWDLEEKLNELVHKFHPAPRRLSQGQFKLMMRNNHQSLGFDLETPSEFILTHVDRYKIEKDGRMSNCKGGTGFAVRLAYANDIPAYNLAYPPHREIVVNKFGFDPQKLKTFIPEERILV